MIAAFLLAASTSVPLSLSPAASVAETWLATALGAIDAQMRATETGRRLLALTAELPVVEAVMPDGPPVAYRRSPARAFVIDRVRVGRLQPADMELWLLRERARATLDVPVELVEIDHAVYQAELEYALERAAHSPEFDRGLRAAYRRAESRAAAGGFARGPDEEGGLPAEGLERVGALVHLYAEDADQFYWAVERHLASSTSAVRLSELADFLALYGKRLDDVHCPASGRYCRIDGKTYVARLVAAARSTTALGGIDRLQEHLGVYRTVAAGPLAKKVRRWVRSSGG